MQDGARGAQEETWLREAGWDPQPTRARLAQQTLPAGRVASLSESEVVTLALFSQWALFRSERAFYRYAVRHLRTAFPTLPDRAQYNRLVRRHAPTLARLAVRLAARLAVRLAVRLAARLGAATSLYQTVDTTGVPTRNCKRRHCGWLPACTGLGYCSRVGWYEGFRLLICATAEGVVTGFALGEAQRKDQPLAEAFFAARALPDPRLLTVGAWYGGFYVLDAGFEGPARHAHWAEDHEAQVVCMPNRSRPRQTWSRALRRWLAGVRQIAETVHARLMETVGLTRDRPHAYDGFSARLAAKIALHNFCCWLNRQLGRPLLAFAELLDW